MLTQRNTSGVLAQSLSLDVTYVNIFEKDTQHCNTQNTRQLSVDDQFSTVSTASTRTSQRIQFSGYKS